MYRSITALVLLLTSAYSWGQTIEFDHNSYIFTPAGEVETVQLLGTGFGPNGLAVGGIDLAISNPSVLTLQSVTFGQSAFDQAGCGSDFSPTSCAVSTSGVIDLPFAQLLSTADTTGTFNIATFNFLVTNSTACTAANPCTTDLNLSAGCDCIGFFDNSGGSVSPNLQSAAVTVESAVVTQVPEIDSTSAASALALLLGSLALLCGRRALLTRACCRMDVTPPL